MADFSFITARLATGAAISDPADLDQLVAAASAGRTQSGDPLRAHILDCRAELDDLPLLASHPSISYLFAGVPDDGLPKPTDWFARGISFALPALATPGHKVYCHCAAGINRGPSMAYAVMRAWGLGPNQAETLIRAARPQVALAYKFSADSAIIALGFAP